LFGTKVIKDKPALILDIIENSQINLNNPLENIESTIEKLLAGFNNFLTNSNNPYIEKKDIFDSQDGFSLDYFKNYFPTNLSKNDREN
jgi:hypothetical protein